MAETQLITITNVRSYADLDPKYDSDRFDIYVTSVQRNYLRNLMGEEMWYDFWQKYPDAGVYDDLVNGKDYTYGANNITYYGLKPWLSFLVLSRITLEGDFFQSDYGNNMFGNDPQSYITRADNKIKSDMHAFYMTESSRYREDIIKFITDNSSDYPLWISEFQPADPRQTIITGTLK